VLEIIFAIGLIFSKTRKIFAILTSLYFIAILPSHIHVSVNQIEMFGISSPLLLWGRTGFQVVVIYWAHACGKVSKKAKKVRGTFWQKQ